MCNSLKRLGASNDGGYVVPTEALERATLLLSFGLATNWTFERAATALYPALRIEAYDHSVGKRSFIALGIRAALSVPLRLATLDVGGALSSARKAALALDYFRFFSGRHHHHQQRVWYSPDANSADIEDILESCRTLPPLSTFAKIDIELAEYRIIPAIRAHASSFTGLVIEFHHTDICAELFERELRALREAFEVVHVHGNNHGDLNVDHTLPLSLEITFLNKRLFAGTPLPYTGSLPRPGLDAPNDRRHPDYQLRLA